ncbi:MAG TPA: CHASE2 domain-containing protein [Thermodesulfobacteriota bacterium]|nr:CHASE2 domain-containing protein [Thermodesulfobacteriota bacterium]
MTYYALFAARPKCVAAQEKRKRIITRDRKDNRPILFYGLVLSVLLFSLNLVKPSLLDFLHHRVYDSFLSSSTSEPSPVPVIVDIDERSLRQYGQWPWPRYRIATLADKLRNLGALSIGLDMLFAEEDRTSILSIKKEILRDFGVDLGFREVPPGLRDNDQTFANVLSKGPFLLGYQFLFEEDSDSGDRLLHPLTVYKLTNDRTNQGSPTFIHARGVSSSLKAFSQAAAGSGFFNVSPDGDGILRRVPLIIEYKEKLYPSLALATLMKALGVCDVFLKVDAGGGKALYLNRTAIPLSSNGSMLIRFRGKGKGFNYVSAADILSDRVLKGRIDGKVVFIGTSASGLKELKATPLDPLFPGVEVHATVVDNILKKDFLSRPEWAAGLESAGMLALGLLSAVILAWTGAGWSLVFHGALAAGVWQASVWMFRNEGIFLSPVLSLIALGFNFSIITLFRYWKEEQRVKARTRELAIVQEATIESMSSLTETRDPDTGGHIKRTQNYIRLLAEYLKNQPGFTPFLDDEAIDLLYKSAPLHDIGKVGVSDRILLKPDRLTDQEFEEMKQHTVYGRDTILVAERKLGNTSFLRVAREIAYTHHERWDGSGYPEGLKGGQIPVPGRLMALADTYDALTSKRVYKSPLPHEEAVQIIVEAKGGQFDPAVVDAFLQIKEDFRRIALRYADT